MKAYEVILQGVEVNEAINFARNFDFSECEISEESIKYKDFIETINGVNIYYDYGADYFFFTPNF